MSDPWQVTVAAGAAGLAVLVLIPWSDAAGPWPRPRRLPRWAGRVAGRVRRAPPPVVELLGALVAELGAGQPTGRALVAAASGLDPVPCPAALRAAVSGGRIVDALRRDAADQGAPALAMLAACWEVAEHSGAGLALAVTRLAEGVRASSAAEHQLAGEVAAVRASARLLAGLPIVGLLLGHWIGAAPIGFLTGSPLGWSVLLGGLGLQVGGVLWLHRIVARIRADL